MTDRTSRAVAPVSAVCAAFRTQPSRVPAGSHKTGRCADVRECPAELQHRSRSACGRLSAEEKPQAARQDKAAVSCAPRDGHICPRCGQFGDFAEGLLQARK